MKTLQNRLLLILALPIIVVYGIVAVVQLRVESGDAVRQSEILMGDNVGNHAKLCDKVFTSAAESAQGLANYIEIANPDATDGVTDSIQALLETHPTIVGSTIAYEPRQFHGYETRHAPYLYKSETAADVGAMVGDFRYKDLAKESDYTHDDWYTAPLRKRKPVWSEPYLDTAGAGSLMCTYSVPSFTPSGELKYIATIDISLGSIRAIANQGDTTHSDCILFSKQGTVITSRNTELEMKATASSLLADWGVADAESIVAAMRDGRAGSYRVYSSRLREGIFLSFAPLPTNGWSLLVTMHEHDVTRQVYKKVFTSMAIFFAGIVVLVFVIRFMVVQTGFVFRREIDVATAESQREHEVFVKDVFQSIQDGIFIIDKDYTILRTNPTFDAMYADYMPLVGRKCWETSCLDRVCDGCPAEKMFRSGKLELSVHYEPPTTTKPGMWLEHFSYPVFDDNREVVGGIGFIRDVTQRKEMETKLQQYQTELENVVAERTTKLLWSESKMNAVLQGSVGIIFYSPDGLTEGINPAMEHLIGYTESEVVGQSAIGLVQEAYREPLTDLLQQFVAKNEVFVPRLDIPAVHKDGRILWLDCSITGIYDAAGKLAQLALIGIDITEKRSLLESLEVAKELAEQSTRAKSEFLANMSHEIRTPMNAILGMTYLCLQTDLNEKQRDYLEKSQAATTGLLSVINDILDFSKIEAGKLAMEDVPFKLGQVMREVGDVLEHKVVEKGLTFQTAINDDVQNALVGDPLRLKQILLNLVGNAVKFTKNGGVTVNVTAAKPTGNAGANVTLVFSVRDTGIGMDAAQVSRLFSAFTQADTSTTRKYGGTGLGLAISKNLIEMMGGKIEVASTPKVGTTFQFTVCLKVDDADHIDDDNGSSATQDLHWAKVLLVEDNKINQIVAKELLKSCGVSVTIANDGLEAITLVRDNSFDLILMDVQMPNMDGLEATRVIRQMNKPGLDKLPILAMTAHAMQSDFDQSIAAGMNDHLTKPIDPSKLRKALAKWLRK